MAESSNADYRRAKIQLGNLFAKMLSITLASLMILGTLPTFSAFANDDEIADEVVVTSNEDATEESSTDLDDADDLYLDIDGVEEAVEFVVTAGELIGFVGFEPDELEEGLTVTYNAAESYCLISDQSKYEAGEVVSVLFEPEPLRFGYKFIGWALTTDAAEPDFFLGTSEDEAALVSFIIEADTTLYAVWEEAEPAGIMPLALGDSSHTVTFWNWNGVWLGEYIVEDGGSAVAPAAPSREGYTFSGWDESFTEVYDDLEVTAQFTAIVYTIDYNANGGVLAPINQSTYTIEDTPFFPSSPTRENQEFIGWTINGGSTIYYGVPVDQVGHITLTAQWVNYGGSSAGSTQTFYDGENSFIVGRTTENGKGTWFIIVKDPGGRILYAVTGIDLGNGTEYNYPLNSGGYELLVNFSGNKFLGVEFKKVRVTFDPGAWGSFELVVHSLEIGADPNAYLPANYTTPRSLGYFFTGWLDSNGRFWPLGTRLPNVTQGVRYIAQWAERSYTVNYDTDGGTPIDSLQSVKWAQSNLLPESNPVKTGYTFVRWETARSGGTDVTAETTYADLADNDDRITSVTIYAVFEENSNYTVKYDTNGGLPAIADLTNVSWTQADLLPAEPTRDGYTFAGWNVVSGGNKTGVVATDTYSDLANNDATMSITLQAQWTEKSNYTVYYDTAGGTPDSINPLENVSWTQTNLLPASPTRDGYTFVGWKVSVGGSKPGVTVADSYGDLAIDDETMSITLQAQWVENANVTIYYVAETGGSVSRANESVAPATGTALGSTATAAPGYTFTGWTTTLDPDVTILTGATVLPLKNGGIYEEVTYTATFTQNANVTIYYVAETGGSVSRANESVAPATGTALGSTATAAPGYTFSHWTTSLPTDATDLSERTVAPQKNGGVYQNVTYTAIFTENS
ncbi:MAG: InlB B-repeat-containing protein, partial [Coriobacteriia bacterium]|nr:InlB B-repeat-containing protein [Coriobacteriia bacterium]